MQKGIIRFLPLLIVAVLLVAVVGYVSVKEIKNASKSAVLSDSDSGGSNDSGSSGGSGSGSSGDSTAVAAPKIETEVKSATGTRTELEVKNTTGTNDLNENELDTEENGLEDVGGLEVDIPDLKPEIEVENKVMEKGIVDKVDSTELQASEAGKPRVARVKGTKNLRFLGVVPVSASVTIDVNSITGEQLATVSEPFFLKYFDFLFTK